MVALLLLAAVVPSTVIGAEAPAEPSTVEVLITTRVLDAARAGAAGSSDALPEGTAPDAPLDALLVVEPRRPGEGETRTVPVAVPGSARVVLPAATIWRAHLQATGFWSPSLPFSTAEPEGLEIPLHPAGRAEGQVEVRQGDLPAELTLFFEPSLESGRRTAQPPTAKRHDPTLPRGSVSCPVSERGRWSCELPAGRLDLQGKAEGFASVFRWDVPMSEGETVSLGRLLLQPGASLFGFVSAADGAFDPQDVEIELSPAAVRDARNANRLDLLARTTRPDERGFFRFGDLAAGYYGVEVRADGYAPLELRPVRVLAGRDSDLGESLVLERPARLSVRVDPPASHHGAPWWVHLVPADTRLPALEGEALPDGTWSTATAVPGAYELRIGGPDGEHWASREVDLRSGAQALEVELPLVPLEGTVTRGGQPVRARVTFTAPDGDRSILFYSDTEGRFQGWLPEEGLWSVDLLFEWPGAHQEVAPVRVERPSEGAAVVDVEVPGTELRGVVRDSDGRPVPHAQVQAWSPERSVRGSRTRTDPEGRFRFRGLALGDYDLTAFRHMNGGTAQVRLDASPEPVQVEVRLQGRRSWNGRVLSPEGPVAGAEIWIRAEVESPRQLPYGQAITGPLGEFQAEIPSDARWLDVLVLPFGRGARLLRLAPEQAPDIVVDDLGGYLEIQLEGIPSSSARLVRGAGWIHLAPLRNWSQAHGVVAEGTTLLLPAMEPGSYDLCTRDAETCDRAYLAPDGLARLRLEE